MSTLSDNMKACQSRVAAILAWRANPIVGTMVTIKGVSGVHRFEGIAWNGSARCVKQSPVAIYRAEGASALPNDRGPSHVYDMSRLVPVDG